MNLFRLDYCDANGTTTGPVLGSDIGILPGGVVLTRHMTTARARAIHAADLAKSDVLITRISGGGAMKPSLVIRQDGTGKRPPGTRTANGPDCVAGTGRSCFCANCRAGRRR